MKPTLTNSDFLKVKRFIETNSIKLSNTSALVKEFSSTELQIGQSHIVKKDSTWIVTYGEETLDFGTKRNAMYAAFLIAYNHKDLITSLSNIDKRLELCKLEIERFQSMLQQTRDSWKTELYHIKLSESVVKYKKVKHELHDWMNYAKYIN